jgi:16S rRNA (uracil1498-N3)-methyltransferase
MRYFSGNLNEKHELILDEQELRHCLKVLRQKEGDKITVINGKGELWTAAITGQTRQNGRLEILDYKFEQDKTKSTLHLAIAPTKNADRIEWLLEKATELGLKKLSILYTNRTERKRIKINRLNMIAMSAIKQSRQVELPCIEEIEFDKLIGQANTGLKYIATCEWEYDKDDLQALDFKQSAMILVGPEGDFTSEELSKAIQSGYRPLSLGENRLRTETAGLLLAANYYMKNTLS